MNTQTLHSYLAHACPQITQGDRKSSALSDVVISLSKAAVKIATLAAQNGINSPSLGTLAGGVNDDGDHQKQLDMMADEIIISALENTAVGRYFSEEQTAHIMMTKKGVLGLHVTRLMALQILIQI